MRDAGGGVERWQEAVADVFGHVQEFAFVPLDVVSLLLDVFSEDMA